MPRRFEDYDDDDRDFGEDDDRGDYDIRRRPPPSINNYLAPAILCTLFCCLPFGIVAIVNAAQVNAKLAAGDYEGAEASAQQARTWCWVSFGVGLAVGILYVAYFVVMDGMNRGGIRF
jgi:hypothetical protein